MPPKSSRLSASEVVEVLKKGSSLKVGTYGGKYLKTASPLKVAVIVPKKGVRGAVERNRLRRLAYKTLKDLEAPATGKLALFVRT